MTLLCPKFIWNNDSWDYILGRLLIAHLIIKRFRVQIKRLCYFKKHELITLRSATADLWSHQWYLIRAIQSQFQSNMENDIFFNIPIQPCLNVWKNENKIALPHDTALTGLLHYSKWHQTSYCFREWGAMELNIHVFYSL